ncbi:DUF7504 family protein [Natronomonas sp. EA1]|uniref:DUF7504 family protein n=1 Tax=Natronomonas sp. EA1 TaxID=3421655 RepID=UPI003EB87D77
MYTTAGSLPVESLAAGSRLRCLGPPMAGKRSLLIELLAAGVDAGEAAIVITTDMDAKTLFAAVPALDVEGVAVVDATGTATTDDRVHVVNSPSDLTGIAIATTEAVTAFTEAGYDRIRVGVDSLSTLRVYSDGKRLFRFFHLLTGRARDEGALFVCTDHDTDGGGALGSLFDVRVELREGETGSERRVTVDGETTEWEPAAPYDVQRVEHERTVHAISVRSFQHVRDVLTGDDLTLVACNPTVGDSDLEAIRAFFEGLAVTVETRQVEGFPNSVALLHRGGEFLAADQLVTVAAAVTIDDSVLRRETVPDVIQQAYRSVHGDHYADPQTLVRVSRQFELEAGRGGVGTVHAGFRRLSRVTADAETWDLYRRLAAAGVEIHIYGEPDIDLPDHEGITVHTDLTDELRETWFVVRDGPTGGALLAEEVEPETVPEDGPVDDHPHRGRYYDAIWTRRADVVDGLVDYLGKQQP